MTSGIYFQFHICQSLWCCVETDTRGRTRKPWTSLTFRKRPMRIGKWNLHASHSPGRMGIQGVITNDDYKSNHIFSAAGSCSTFQQSLCIQCTDKCREFPWVLFNSRLKVVIFPQKCCMVDYAFLNMPFRLCPSECGQFLSLSESHDHCLECWDSMFSLCTLSKGRDSARPLPVMVLLPPGYKAVAASTEADLGVTMEELLLGESLWASHSSAHSHAYWLNSQMS